jgi:predicted aspartyl protease
MMRFKVEYILLIVTLLCSCGGNKRNKEKFDPNIWTDNTAYEQVLTTGNETISIPYVEKNGVKYIAVKINGGPTFDMIVDTGCSGVLISIKEAQYLAQSGLLTEEDYRGNALSSIADGSIVENMVFNIKEMIIGGKIVCSDVDVTVSNNISAPMLLGNGVFDRISSFSIDNANKQIIFHL